MFYLLNSVEPRRMRRLVFADDLYQLSKVPLQRTVHVVKKAIENLSGYQSPKHMNFGQYLASNVPSLKEILKQSTNLQKGNSILKAPSSVMILLQRCEFKMNHEKWIKSVKPKLGSNVSEDVLAAVKTSYDDMKTLYKVRTDTRIALQSFLKVGRIMELGVSRLQVGNSGYCTMTQAQMSKQLADRDMKNKDVNNSQALCQTEQNIGDIRKHQIGENVSRKDKVNFLVHTLLDLRDSKEVVYGALDAWVAWEQNFPIASLKQALATLENEQQWHRVVQVIKWMLSKGQGTTMRVYWQLIRALDMDHRAKEAHKFWVMKIGSDLHSVPWQLCRSMIAIYYRNKMLEDLVKLFKDLEAFGRKPPEKSIVQRMADACEMLGLLEEKERVLVKYKDLFTDEKEGSKKHKRISFKKSGKKKIVQGH